MRTVTLALALGWWFVVYPIDAPHTMATQPRLHGPYRTLAACLADALEIDMTVRRAFTSYCFQDR